MRVTKNVMRFFLLALCCLMVAPTLALAGAKVINKSGKTIVVQKRDKNADRILEEVEISAGQSRNFTVSVKSGRSKFRVFEIYLEERKSQNKPQNKLIVRTKVQYKKTATEMFVNIDWFNIYNMPDDYESADAQKMSHRELEINIKKTGYPP